MPFPPFNDCPECGAFGGHKMSCSAQHKSAVAVDWRDRQMVGNVAALHAKGLPSYFEADLISHVEGNLWQGGCIQDTKLDDDFVGVVSLYPWERYTLGPDTKRVEFKMYDSPSGIDWADLDAASDLVLSFMEKGKTLVHCQAGLNRSGLVAAVALMKLGRTADEAITLLRESRSPMVLCNDTFVSQLHQLDYKMRENA